jgi:holo-[acyl-carrier protein] synthase
MILKTGVDIIEIDRIAAAINRHSERFLKRVFTAQEIIESRARPDALSVLFAAKEATTKALGTGIGPVSWLEVETLHRPSGEPYLVLHGRAELIANYLGLKTWAVSLSHSKEFGVAMVVATGD